MKTKKKKRNKGFKHFGGKKEHFCSFKRPHQKMEPRINDPIAQGKSTPIKCWRFVGDHYLSIFHQKKNKDSKVYNSKDAYTVGDATCNIPRIYEYLENFQANHQSSMIKIEGKINNLPVSILIDSEATFIYVNTNLAQRCTLVGIKLHKRILVQLAIGMKRKVTAMVEDSKFTMNGL